MDLTPSVATVQERWAGCPDKYRTYRLNISKLLFLCFTLICVPFGIAQTEPFDQPDSERYDKSSPLQSRMHDFDIRLSSPRDMKSTDDTVLILARTERHDAIVMAFQQRFGAEDGLLRLSLNADGMVVSLSRQHDFLSGPVEGNPVEVAKSFLAAHGDLFRLNASEINGLRLIRQEAKQNLVYLRFYQTLNDVDVFE